MSHGPDASHDERDGADGGEIEFPASMTPAEVIEAGKTKVEQARAAAIAAIGETSGRALAARLTRFHDALIRALWRHLLARWEAAGKGSPGSLAVVALGGYGRRELSLHSDIDLLFLIGDRKGAQEAFVKELIHTLIDWRLETGFVVRRLDECLMTINADSESATAMLESRWLAGSRPLVQHFQETFLRALRGGGKRWFLQMKFEEWKARHDKFDSSVYLLEPNLKESKGGLRDIHTVQWLMQVTTGNSELSNLEKLEILDAAEVRRLKQAEDFVFRLRVELHALLPRKSDVLNFDAQVEIAKRWGYERDESALAEEKLMREYYRNARRIAKLASRSFYMLLGRERSALGTLIGSWKRKRIDAHYTSVDGVIFLHKGQEKYLAEDPTRIMALFARARRLGLKVSDRTRDAIEAIVPKIDEDFASAPANQKNFREIIAGPERVSRTLGDMHDCGVLTAFIPEFENVHCMVRMDYYHRYTVDEHLIKAVEMLEKLLSDAPPHLAHAAQVAREIERKDLLNLALLLHDVGKGQGKGHAIIGGQLVQRIGPRAGFEPDEVELVRFLVLSHLKFSHVSQRRDLDAPEVARQMAEEVQSFERLRLLYVHSVCDLMAVSPLAMTEWKAQLYEALFRVTARELGEAETEESLPEFKTDVIAERVMEYLEAHPEAGYEEDEKPPKPDLEREASLLDEFLAGVPERYLQTTRVEHIAEHFRMRHRMDEKTRILWALHAGSGSISELTVCSADVPGSFALTCGALAVKDVNICSAQIYSTHDGYAINRFQLTDVSMNPLPHGFRLERLRADLNQVLLGKRPMEELIEKYDKHRIPRPPKRTARESEVRVDNEASHEFTVLELRTTDRPGLLYQIASVLDQHRLNIYRAMATTEAYGVFDVFYVTDLEYNKVHDAGQIEKLTRDLRRVLDLGQTAPENPAEKPAEAQSA